MQPRQKKKCKINESVRALITSYHNWSVYSGVTTTPTTPRPAWFREQQMASGIDSEFKSIIHENSKFL